MKTLGEFELGMSVSDLRKVLSSLDKRYDSAKVVMSFNGCDDGLRLVSELELTDAYSLLDPSFDDDLTDQEIEGRVKELEKEKVLHFYSDRFHYEP